MVDKIDKIVGENEGFIVKNVKKGLFSPIFDIFHVLGPSFLYMTFSVKNVTKITHSN